MLKNLFQKFCTIIQPPGSQLTRVPLNCVHWQRFIQTDGNMSAIYLYLQIRQGLFASLPQSLRVIEGKLPLIKQSLVFNTLRSSGQPFSHHKLQRWQNLEKLFSLSNKISKLLGYCDVSTPFFFSDPYCAYTMIMNLICAFCSDRLLRDRICWRLMAKVRVKLPITYW